MDIYSERNRKRIVQFAIDVRNIHAIMNQGAKILGALSRIGYPKANEFEGDSLEWLFDCESVVPFLEWFCDNIHESNVLSVEDLKR